MCQTNGHGWWSISRAHFPVQSHSCTSVFFVEIFLKKKNYVKIPTITVRIQGSTFYLPRQSLFKDKNESQVTLILFSNNILLQSSFKSAHNYGDFKTVGHSYPIPGYKFLRIHCFLTPRELYIVTHFSSFLEIVKYELEKYI